MRDQVKIKNVEIRVIKCDRVWNDDREEKNEDKKQRMNLLQLWVKSPRRTELLRLQIKPKRAKLLVLQWRIHGHNISDGIASSFFRKKKIRDYFYEIGWMSYESKWLGIFVFCFWMGLLLNILFICCYLA